jgi:hypothetical protein
MKTFLLVIMLHAGVCISQANAQKAIILTKFNIPIKAGTVHNHTASLTGFIVPKADTNHIWNYSGLVSTGTADANFVPNPFLKFAASGAAIADTGKTEHLTSTSIVTTHLIYDEDTSGLYQAGNYVKAQNYSLANYFGEPKDSLKVPAQSDFCKIRVLSFPTTFKSAHKTKAMRSLNFFISLKSGIPAPYKNAPGSKNTYFDYTDTTIGWGTIRIPSPNKASKPYPVLLIQRRTIAIDSFFINKQPASAVLLNALGEKQGARTASYQESFYRAGYAAPIMTINFGADSTYKTPTSVLYASDSITSGIEIEKEQVENFSIYPNPVSDGNIINCHFTKISLEPWRLVMLNTLGQVVADRNITGYGDMNTTIETSVLKNAGIYFVNVIDENGQVAMRGKLSVVR